MKIAYWIVALIIIIISSTVIVWYLLLNDDQTSPDNNPQDASELINEKSERLLIGQESAPVTIIKYIDFKCPNCYRFMQQAGSEIIDDYVDIGRANFEIRVLPYLGADSRLAAEGAYCANEQNKFVDYHDSVYKYLEDNYYSEGKNLDDDVFNPDSLNIIAQISDLDISTFETCISNEEKSNQVDEDLALSEAERVTGTPTIIISDRTIVGLQPYQIYRSLIETELSQ